MQGKIVIILPDIPKDCGRCKYAQGNICVITNNSIIGYSKGGERPNHCKIEVLSKSVLRRDALMKGDSIEGI